LENVLISVWNFQGFGVPEKNMYRVRGLLQSLG